MYIVKGYDSGGLFCLPLHDVCNKSMNNVISNGLYRDFVTSILVVCRG
jgi:hypothetical protein